METGGTKKWAYLGIRRLMNHKSNFTTYKKYFREKIIKIDVPKIGKVYEQTKESKLFMC